MTIVYLPMLTECAPVSFVSLALAPLVLGQAGVFQSLGTLSAIGEIFAHTAQNAEADKKSYAEKLENARGDDVFKYILLINVAALEGYVAQTRVQAEQSFRLARIIASTGFAILAVGIVLAVYLSLVGRPTLEAAYLTAISGVLTEFISGVFFYLYNRTLQQINRFHDKLVGMQQTSMAYLATGLVADRKMGDDARLALATGAAQFTDNASEGTANAALHPTAAGLSVSGRV